MCQIIRKSVNDVLKSPDREKEYYVMVSRYYPRKVAIEGIKCEDFVNVWDRELAPSAKLLKEFKTKGNWNVYVLRFREEIDPKFAVSMLAEHCRDAEGKTVVLVCEEESSDPKCHTWLLLDMWSQGQHRHQLHPR